MSDAEPNPAATTDAVAWQQLELRGFGRHLSLQVSFGTGLTTLVAPNEFGKSTLVAGLTATVFGLPHLSDPTKFGRDRFRNWANPSRFEGSVVFRARDGQTHAIHRNFETHEVRIVRLGTGGAEEIFDGQHNPNARTGTGGFESHLETLVGMTNREAFQQSFHVAQPLPPPEQLGEEVQRLLSGSGQGTFRSGLEQLENEVTDRTRASGDLGVTTRNKNKDRRREELEQRITELERDLHEGRAAADQAKEVGEKLDRLMGDKTKLAARETELEASVGAYRAWLDARDDHERALDDHREIERALGKAREMSAEIETSAEAIMRDWPEFTDAPEALEQKLTAAHQAEVRLSGLEEAVATARADVERETRASEETTAALAAHDATEPERPGEYDAEDLQRLRLEAEQARADWARLQERESEVRKLEEELAAFESLESADEPTREMLRNYRWELDRRERDAAAEAETLRRAQEQADARRPGRSGWVVRLLVGVVAALLVGAGVFFFTESALMALLAAVVAGAAGFLLAPTDPAKRAGLGSGQGERSGAAPHPTGSPGPGHEGETLTAQQTLDTFVEATRPFVESFQGYGDPADAVRAWEERRQAVAQERRSLAEHAERVWGVEPDRVRSLEPAVLAGSWGNLVRYAQTQGDSFDTLEGLAAWLARQERETWDAAIGRAEDSARGYAAWQTDRSNLDRAALEAATRKGQAENRLEEAETKLEAARAAEAAARSEVEDLLERTGRSAGELLEAWRAFRAAVRDRDAHKGNLAALLKGRDAQSVEELERRAQKAGLEVMRIANNVDELRREHPELPPLNAERETVARRWRDLDTERKQVAQELAQVQESIFATTRMASELEGKDLVNIAQVELELVDLKEERDRLNAEIDALVIAYRELQAAVTDFQASHRERLERAATGYVQAFSDVEGRRVALGDDFAVSVIEPDGTEIHPGQLSQGAQDQLLLALRLAIADHLSDDAPLPLILDDPFLNWDASRLDQVESALHDLANGRQVILLSHRDEFADWGEAAEIGR